MPFCLYDAYLPLIGVFAFPFLFICMCMFPLSVLHFMFGILGFILLQLYKTNIKKLVVHEAEALFICQVS